MSKDQDVIFDALDIILGQCADLYCAARAFDITGYAVMSDRLAMTACDISAAADSIRDAYISIGIQRVRDAEQATANMLGLAVALGSPKA